MGANDEDHADGGISDGKVRSDTNNNDDDESNDGDDDDPWRLTGMNDDIGRDKTATSSEDDDDWRPMRVAVESLVRSVLSLPSRPSLVQFVGLMPRTVKTGAVGSGEYGAPLEDYLPQMRRVLDHYGVPLVVYHRAITHATLPAAPPDIRGSSGSEDHREWV